MIRSTTITKRLAGGLAVAAVVAAFAAPAALAGSARSDGPLDAWAVKYVSPGGVVGLPDAWAVKYLTPGTYGQPDAWAVKYLSPGGVVGLPDPWAVKYLTPRTYGQPDAWAVKYLNPTTIPATFQVPASRPIVSGDGFDWSSFGIGIGAGIGALLVLGAVAVRLGKLRPLASA
jgi:hypothetical protein